MSDFVISTMWIMPVEHVSKETHMGGEVSAFLSHISVEAADVTQH